MIDGASFCQHCGHPAPPRRAEQSSAGDEQRGNRHATLIICAIDRSGSMGVIRDAAIAAFNEFLESQRKKCDGARATVVLFNTTVYELCSNVPFGDVPRLTGDSFVPSGYTALYDAVCDTIEHTVDAIARMKRKARPSGVMFVTLTDGGENSSVRWTRTRAAELRAEMEARHGWCFVDLTAGSEAETTVRGIGARSVGSWNQSPAGIRNAVMGASDIVTQYRANPVAFQVAYTAMASRGGSAWTMVSDAALRGDLINAGTHATRVKEAGIAKQPVVDFDTWKRKAMKRGSWQAL